MGEKNILRERVFPEAEKQAHELAPWVAQDAGDTGEGRLRRRRGLPGNAPECGLTGGGTHGARDEDQAGAGRSEAARGRPGRGRGAPWASGRPRRGARRPPHALPLSGRLDFRGRRRRAQLFPPRRGSAGEGGGKHLPGGRGAKPRPSSRGGAERSPDRGAHAELRPFFPAAAFMPQLRGRDCPRLPTDTPAPLADQ